MADVITRFKLETTQYDSKLRDSVKGMKEVIRQAELGGKTFGGFDKKTLEAARALGTLETSATNSKDKVKELVGAFNDMAKSYNVMSKTVRDSDVGQALSESLSKLSERIKDAKQELYGLGDAVESKGGGLFSGAKFDGMLQVFGGNLMTKAAGAVAKLGSEMADAVKEGVELAKQGESVRMAFERLNKPGLLNQLKEATHGTVTNLELMKAAVKFDDFKLPLKELGTMLAFAQKKAKDTGQSVDYMVDSIVTGLGRKSLMILDNLGLSAAEVKEKMKETGDMTTAVGAIIREQMSKAGDYVETAADRAARSTAETKDKLEELGRTAMPVAEEWAQAWNDIKMGGLEVLNDVVGPLLHSWATMQNMLRNGGLIDWDAVYNNPNNVENPNYQNPNGKRKPGIDHTVYSSGGYVEVTDSKTGKVISGKHFDNLGQNQIDSWFNSLKGSGKGGKGGKGGSSSPKTQEQLNIEAINRLTLEYITASEGRREAIRAEIEAYQDSNKQIKILKDEAQGKYSLPIVGMRGIEQSPIGITNENPFEKYKTGLPQIITPLQQLEEELKNIKALQSQAWSPEVFAAYQAKITEVQGKIDAFKGIKKDADTSAKSFSEAASAISTVGTALQSIQDPSAKIAGIVGQAIANIALGFAQATAASSGGGIFGWIAAIVGGMATMMSTIETIHSATGYAQGGVIDGNHYSGDMQIARVNAGETILTRAQAGNLVSQLDGGGLQNLRLSATISGEQIRLALNNNGRRTGRGEYVTTNFRRYGTGY